MLITKFLIWFIEISVKLSYGTRATAAKLFACLSLLLSPLFVHAQFAGGNGTEKSPYQIATPEQLAHIHSYADKFLYFILTRDLDLRSFDAGDGGGWAPIGSEAGTPFNGTFNGNGKAISNLTIRRPNASQVGLFGYMTGGAVVTNLTLKNVEILAKEDVGSLVGLMVQGSMLTGCHASGRIYGNVSVGGLVGYARTGALVKNSSASCVIYGAGDYTGGLVGEMYAAAVENSTSKGYIYSATSNTGGLVAYMSHGSTIRNCYSSCHIVDFDDTVNYRLNRYNGGLVGQAFNGSSIENCYASGNVSGKLSVGGLMGWISKDVHSYANVALNQSVVGMQDVRPVLGELADATLEHQYSRADMLISENGITQTNPSTVEDGYNIVFSNTQMPFYRRIGWKFGVDENNPWCFDDATNYPILWFEGVPVSAISLNVNLVTLYPGDTCDLSMAKVEPAHARLKLVWWRSANTNVVSVNEEGTVKANGLGLTTITVRTADGGYEVTCRVNVIPRPISLGMDDNEAVQVKVYPNPVRDILHIEASTELIEVKIYNALGQLLLEQRVQQEGVTAIDVSQLPKGLHVLVARAHNGYRSIKFVVF